jgi:hypothetical protein
LFAGPPEPPSKDQPRPPLLLEGPPKERGTKPSQGRIMRGIGSLMRGRNVFSLIQALREGYELLPEEYQVLDEAFQYLKGTQFSIDKPGIESFKELLGISPEDLGETIPLPDLQKYIATYHGGPSEWAPEPGYPEGRPLLEKTGTGEGAAAYGHGFYLAESKGVAADYRRKLALQKFNELSDVEQALIPDHVTRRIKLGDPDSGVNAVGIVQFWRDLARHRSQTSRVKEEILRLRRGRGRLEDPEYAELEKAVRGPGVAPAWSKEEQIVHYEKLTRALEKLKTSKNYEMERTGALYKIDIPEADVAKLLDWDAPLSEQTPGINAALKKMLGADEYLAAVQAGVDGRELVKALGRSTRGSNIVTSYGSDQAASEALRKAGIPGLKYYDAKSRAAKEGTRNYVIWDQGLLDQLRTVRKQAAGGFIDKPLYDDRRMIG